MVRGKPHSWCKLCQAVSTKAYYERNKTARNQRIVTIQRARRLGLTHDEYVALPADPGQECSVCGCSPTDARNGKFSNGAVSPRHKNLAIDHCHQTGRIRGFLCSQCNQALGLMADSPALIRQLAEYLETPGLGWEPLPPQKSGRKPDPNRVIRRGDPAAPAPFRPSSRSCSIDGCENKHFGNGFCRGHWRRWKRWGNPLGGRSPNGTSAPRKRPASV